MKQDLYVYFLYSDQQLQERKTIEKSISKSFVLGNVIVNGRKKMLTELSTKPTNRYADCKVVAEGYKSTMNYTLPSI